MPRGSRSTCDERRRWPDTRVARQHEHGGPRGHDCRSERDCHRRGRLGLIPDFDRKVRRAADPNI